MISLIFSMIVSAQAYVPNGYITPKPYYPQQPIQTVPGKKK